MSSAGAKTLRFGVHATVIAVGIVLAQGLAARFLPQGESTPSILPLTSFPSEIGPWYTTGSGILDAQMTDALRADDYLIRSYVNSQTGQRADLLIAHYRTRNLDQGPHSPQTCFPGAGWRAVSHQYVDVRVPKTQTSISANIFRVALHDDQRVVFYWYQTGDRAIAREFVARLYSVSDVLFRNRKDSSLVRIVVPFTGNDQSQAERTATEFGQTLYPKLTEWFSPE